MELNNKALVKVAVLLFLMGFSATVDAARLDPSFIITQLLNNGGALNFPRSSTEEDCCRGCACTLTWPHRQCFCADVTESCHPSCKSCYCTKSIPPQCHCADLTPDNCYIPACPFPDNAH